MRSCLPFVVMLLLYLVLAREALAGVRNWKEDGERIRTRSGNYVEAWLHRIALPLVVVFLPVTVIVVLVCLL